MSITAASTGIMPTVLVAIERFYSPEHRIVDDALALRMLPTGARLVVWCLRPRWLREAVVRTSERDNPGIWGGLLCRKRYIDERLMASAEALEAVINLGAGFDTRAYRLACLRGLPIWEVDQPENIERKADRLRRALGAVPANVKLVAVDFDHEDLGSALAREGYSLAMRTFFVWEGVTQYLTAQGVGSTFDYLAQATRGSRVAFTYVREDFIDGKALYGWSRGYEQFVVSKLWRFGMSPATSAEFVARYGWRVLDDVGYEDLATRYIAPGGRRLGATPVERVVYAEKP